MNAATGRDRLRSTSPTTTKNGVFPCHTIAPFSSFSSSRCPGGVELEHDSPQAGRLPARLRPVRPAEGRRYDKRKVAALLSDAGIVRNRAKIESAIKNAQAFLDLQEEFEPSTYISGASSTAPDQNRLAAVGDIPARSAQSDALSSDLKGRGFTFVVRRSCMRTCRPWGWSTTIWSTALDIRRSELGRNSND